MLFLFSLACSPDKIESVFPDDLSPLEEMKIEAPVGTSSEPYPEEYNVLSNDEGEYAWVHLRGYIQSDMSTVWASLRDDAVYVNQRNAATYDIENIDFDIYDYVFLEHNE